VVEEGVQSLRIRESESNRKEVIRYSLCPQFVWGFVLLVDEPEDEEESRGSVEEGEEGGVEGKGKPER